jgi:hypothetical protein
VGLSEAARGEAGDRHKGSPRRGLGHGTGEERWRAAHRCSFYGLQG